MGPKIVLDTNVLVSALGWGGPPELCFRLVLERRAINFTSEVLLEELSNTLNYPRLEISRRERERFVGLVSAVSVVLNPEDTVNVVKADPDDNRVLECALAAKAESIVSGDSHLREVERFQGIPVVSPREFLDEVEESGGPTKTF